MMTEKRLDDFSSSEEFLRLNEIEKEIYLALARERRRVLLQESLKQGAECPYRGLELCLQHCVCEEGFQGRSTASYD
jgi:hypothetical protein